MITVSTKDSGAVHDDTASRSRDPLWVSENNQATGADDALSTWRINDTPKEGLCLP